MLRTTLFRLAADEHVLLFQPHHIAFDAWAVEILYRDLGELYAAAGEGRAPQLPELPVQYRDFAAGSASGCRANFSSASSTSGAPSWRARRPILRLPTDRRRPAMQTFDGATLNVALDRRLADRVRELCTISGVTPYMLLLAAFATLLYRRSGQDDILFGGPMANREHPGFENLIGFFANTDRRARPAGRQPRRSPSCSRACASRCSSSYEHQEVPLELVVDAVRPQRDPGVNPLFQVNFRVRVGDPPVLAAATARAPSRCRSTSAWPASTWRSSCTSATTASPPSSTTTRALFDDVDDPAAGRRLRVAARTGRGRSGSPPARLRAGRGSRRAGAGRGCGAGRGDPRLPSRGAAMTTSSPRGSSARQSLRNVLRAQPQVHAGVRAAKRARRRAFETLGSDRYSHPAYDDLDRKLAVYLPESGGTFVEAGAFDGYWGSNTYWFERFRDWSGVLVEPLPEMAGRARRERPARASSSVRWSPRTTAVTPSSCGPEA